MIQRKYPFAAVVQLLLVILMLLSIIMMGQKFDFQFYKIGMILLVVTSLSQIAFGNIDPNAGFARSMRMYAIYMVITAALFGVSILLAPILVGLGR